MSSRLSIRASISEFFTGQLPDRRVVLDALLKMEPYPAPRSCEPVRHPIKAVTEAWWRKTYDRKEVA